MTPDIDPFDLDAAILRKNEQDMRAFLSALVARLESAVPGRVTVDRKRDGFLSSATHVVGVQFTTDDAVYALVLDRAGVRTTRAKIVRGVTISNATISAATWIADIRTAVARLSGQSDETADVLGKFL